MDDARVWEFEERLWTGDADHYRRCVSEHVLMALLTEPFLFDGAAAIARLCRTRRAGRRSRLRAGMSRAPWKD